MIELFIIFGILQKKLMVTKRVRLTLHKDRIISRNKRLNTIQWSKVSQRFVDPLYQDIRLEVGESTTFQSGKVDWKCGLCKQVEVTMLNLQHTFNGFEYSYTMQISGKQYQGKMKKKIGL